MLSCLFVWGWRFGYRVFSYIKKLGKQALVPCNMHKIFLGIAHRPEQLVVTNGIEDFESRRFVGFDIESSGGEMVYVLLGGFADGDYLFFEIDKLPGQVMMKT